MTIIDAKFDRSDAYFVKSIRGYDIRRVLSIRRVDLPVDVRVLVKSAVSGNKGRYRPSTSKEAVWGSGIRWER